MLPFENGGHRPRQRLTRIQCQGARRHQRLRQGRPDSVSRYSPNAGHCRHHHRGQTFQAFEQLLFRRVRLATGLPVGVLGLQETKGIGQELLSNRGGPGPVMAVEPLDVPRREPSAGNGRGQGLRVCGIGARNRDQAFHRTVRRDLSGDDQLLNRGRQDPDQVQPPRDPAHGSPQSERDHVETDAFDVNQFLDEQRLLQC